MPINTEEPSYLESYRRMIGEAILMKSSPGAQIDLIPHEELLYEAYRRIDEAFNYLVYLNELSVEKAAEEKKEEMKKVTGFYEDKSFFAVNLEIQLNSEYNGLINNSKRQEILIGLVNDFLLENLIPVNFQIMDSFITITNEQIRFIIACNISL